MNKYKTKAKRKRPRLPKAFSDFKDMAFVQFRRAKILLVTFNVNGKSVRNVASFQSAVEHSIQFKLIAKHRPEVVAICLQECGEVNRLKNFFSETDELVRHDWGEATKARLSFLDYGLATQCYIGCTFLMVYIRNKLKSLYKLYEKAAIPLGTCCCHPCKILRKVCQISKCCVLSDKGACVVQFSIQKQIFLIIGVHLASGDHSHRERMNQIKIICSKYEQLFMSSHFVFWMGDFNFRTGTKYPIIDDVSFLMLSNKEKREGIEEQFALYLSNDQYKIEKTKRTRGKNRADAAEVFFQMEEGEIQFPPTYRVKVHEAVSTNNPDEMVHLPYDLGSRRPSWCDRVFFRDVNGEANMQVEEYNCHLQTIISDHKPVHALVSFDFEFMDVKRFSRDKRRRSDDYGSYTKRKKSSLPSVEEYQHRHSSTVNSDYYTNTFKTDDYSTVDYTLKKTMSATAMERLGEKVSNCGDWIARSLAKQSRRVEEVLLRAARVQVQKPSDFKENVTL